MWGGRGTAVRLRAVRWCSGEPVFHRAYKNRLSFEDPKQRQYLSAALKSSVVITWCAIIFISPARRGRLASISVPSSPLLNSRLVYTDCSMQVCGRDTSRLECYVVSDKFVVAARVDTRMLRAITNGVCRNGFD